MPSTLPPPPPDEATWICDDCGSVCTGDPDTVPSPCSFCGSEKISQVAPAAADDDAGA